MQIHLFMTGLLLMYIAIATVGIKLRKDHDVYLSLDDSNVLKGLWCIDVILVHIPVTYQNRIQDMLGSFAYIGVTFFFMTSAYGLKYGMGHKENYFRGFWIKRLPKLLIPAILVNMLAMLNSTLLA